MNPVLILLILLGAGGLWFLLAFSFNFLGKIINKLKDDATNAMFNQEIGENNDEK